MSESDYRFFIIILLFMIAIGSCSGHNVKVTVIYPEQKIEQKEEQPFFPERGLALPFTEPFKKEE